MADTAITISDDRISQLSNQEIATSGFTHKFRVLYSDIAYGSGSSDTVTLTLGNTPAKWYIDKAGVNVKTAFAGTTAMTVIVGTTTTTNAAIASTSILTAAWIPQASTVPVSTNLKGTSALSLVATFTNATGGSPSALTAGELDLYLAIQNTAALP
jgi:hypothetical protein